MVTEPLAAAGAGAIVRQHLPSLIRPSCLSRRPPCLSVCLSPSLPLSPFLLNSPPFQSGGEAASTRRRSTNSTAPGGYNSGRRRSSAALAAVSGQGVPGRRGSMFEGMQVCFRCHWVDNRCVQQLWLPWDHTCGFCCACTSAGRKCVREASQRSRKVDGHTLSPRASSVQTRPRHRVSDA